MTWHPNSRNPRNFISSKEEPFPFYGCFIPPFLWSMIFCPNSLKAPLHKNLLLSTHTYFCSYSPFTLTWLMTNDFQVEFFSFNYQKQWKLSVCKKSLTKLEWTDCSSIPPYLTNIKISKIFVTRLYVLPRLARG